MIPYVSVTFLIFQIIFDHFGTVLRPVFLIWCIIFYEWTLFECSLGIWIHLWPLGIDRGSIDRLKWQKVHKTPNFGAKMRCPRPLKVPQNQSQLPVDASKWCMQYENIYFFNFREYCVLKGHKPVQKIQICVSKIGVKTEFKIEQFWAIWIWILSLNM